MAWGGPPGAPPPAPPPRRGPAARAAHPRPVALIGAAAGAALTFLAVVVAWVPFRAPTFAGAQAILTAMFSGTATSPALTFSAVFAGMEVPPTSFAYLGGFMAVGFGIVWLFPTTQSIIPRFEGMQGRRTWFCLGMLLFSIGLLAAINASNNSSEFIYFNF